MHTYIHTHTTHPWSIVCDPIQFSLMPSAIITAMIMHVICREVRVFLNCDHTAKVPVITTIGDAVIRHNYVSFHNHYISLQLMCNEPDA